MTLDEDGKARRDHLDKWLKRIFAAYTKAPKGADRTYTEACIELGNLAMWEPSTFWEFIEYVAASSAPIEQLKGLGDIGLYSLLRNYPDSYDKLIAGLVRRDERFRILIQEVDSDRVAPDIWRQIEAALAGD